MVISDPSKHSAQISQKQDGYNTYAIIKTMFPPSYLTNGFVATHALEHMMYGCHVPKWMCMPM